MIARFQTLIQFPVYVQADLSRLVDPEEITVGSVRALIYPPHRSKLEIGDISGESEIPPSEVPRRLDPADLQLTAPNVSIGDGPTIVGDVLRIDLHAPEFDRRVGGDDSLVDLSFNLANSWLSRFKTLNRIMWARSLGKHQVPWKFEFLDDDGVALEREEGKYRARFGAMTALKGTGLDVNIWNAISSLPSNYEPEPSDELLLEAYSLLPQVGPSIVLAAVAVETRIARALDRLAVLTGLNPTLWSWVTDRGDFRKDPSTGEQLDVLVKVLAGKSLKDDQGLWQDFQHLRESRNTFVHEGRATLGRRSIPVDANKALELVQGAERIIDWIESLLPQAERRPRFQSPNPLSISQVLIAVPGGAAPSDNGEAPSEEKAIEDD